MKLLEQIGNGSGMNRMMPKHFWPNLAKIHITAVTSMCWVILLFGLVFRRDLPSPEFGLRQEIAQKVKLFFLFGLCESHLSANFGLSDR